MHQAHGHDNAQSLFGVHEIACDNQIRHLLDAVSPQTLEPLYEHLLQCLMDEGVSELHICILVDLILHAG